MVIDIKKQPALRQKLLVQLMLWKNLLPSQTEAGSNDENFPTETDTWVGYLLMFYNNIKLTLLLPGLLDNMLNAQNDSVREKCMESCRQLNAITRKFLRTPNSLEFMPLYLSQCLIYGGVFNCFMSFLYSNLQCLTSLSDYILALERFGRIYPEDCLPKVQSLQSMVIDPQQSVCHLKELRARIFT